MDWPNVYGCGAHFDKRFADDYYRLGWGYLVELYGEVSLLWVGGAMFHGYPKGGDA